MRNLYGMKRPFDIGTFPNVERINYFDLDFRTDRFYCVIETKFPLTKEDIYKYELKEVDEDFIELFDGL